MRTRYRNRGKYITFGGIFFCLLIVLILGIIFLPSKSYSITFMVDGATNNVISKDGNVDRPADPIKEGYAFIGWYLDGELFNFDRKLDNDTILEARFKALEDSESFMVYFSVDNVITHTKEIKQGEKVGEVVSPNVDNKKFIGWYLGEELYDFNNEVNSSFTLVAKFEEIVNDELAISNVSYSSTTKSVSLYPSINKDVNVSYMYSIDGASYQSSNYFDNLTYGSHNVVVEATLSDSNKVYKEITIYVNKINAPQVVSSNTNITNNDVTLSVVNKGNLDLYIKCNNSSYVKSSKDTLLKENNTCTFKLSDGVNYSDEVSYTVSNIDKTSPIITSNLSVSEVTTKKVVLTSKGVDNYTKSDNLIYKYTMNGITNNDGVFDNVKYSNTPYKASVEIIDEAGNISKEEIDNVSLKAVNTPVVNVSNNYKDSITKDDIVLEVLNKGEFDILVNGVKVNSKKINIVKNGEYEISLSDGVNTSLIPYSIKVSNIDKLGPVVTIKSEEITTKKIVLDVESIDKPSSDYISGSSVNTLYKLDDGEYQSDSSFNNLVANKEYKVTIKSIDEVGNVTKVEKVYKTLEMPIPNIKLNNYSYTKEDISFILIDGEDGNNQDMNLVYSYDNSDYTAINKNALESIKYHNNENKTYIFKYYDGVNYSNELKITISNYDNEAPVITNPLISKTTRKVSFNPIVTDKESIDNITLEFMIDDNDYTSNNTFDNLLTGIHTYKIKATDKAGNQCVLEGEVEILKPISPTFNYNDDNQVITNKDINISVTNKTSDLVLQKVLDNGYEEVSEIVFSTNHEEKYVFFDGVNRSDEVLIKVTKIDKESPVITSINTTSFTTKIVIHPLANEEVTYSYSLDNINFSNSNEINNLEANTNYTIYIKAKDIAGNKTIETVNVSTTNVTSPVINKSITSLTKENVILTKEEDSFTTVYGESEEDVSSTNIKNGDATLFNSITLTSNKTYYFRNYEVVDNKYLFSDVTVVNVDNIDKTKPTLNNISKEVTTKSIKALIDAVDNKSSNLVYDLELKLGDEVVATSDSNSIEVDNLTNNTTYKLVYKITDEALNVLDGEENITTLDLPSLNLTVSNSFLTNEDILLSLGNIDSSFTIYSYDGNALSLISNLEVSEGNYFITILENGTYSFKVSDGVNYSNVYSITISNIDKVAPLVINPVASISNNSLVLEEVDNNLFEEGATYSYILRKVDNDNNVLEENNYLISTTEISNLEEGNYELYIMGVDSVGNSSISNSPFEFNI